MTTTMVHTHHHGIRPNNETQGEMMAFLRLGLLRRSQGMKLEGRSILGLPDITHKVCLRYVHWVTILLPLLIEYYRDLTLYLFVGAGISLEMLAASWRLCEQQHFTICSRTHRAGRSPCYPAYVNYLK